MEGIFSDDNKVEMQTNNKVSRKIPSYFENI